MFKWGFETVMLFDALNVFSSEEILVVVNGNDDEIIYTGRTLRACDSQQVQWFSEVILAFADEESTNFVQFLAWSFQAFRRSLQSSVVRRFRFCGGAVAMVSPPM
jgi:hypothetical protein